MTNFQSPSCQIGDRIECTSNFGTVKFVGSIEGKPSIWLGIDWDDPERGKHNGTLNGVHYFSTRNPKSGSFVRPEKVNFGKSAIASVESRYGQSEDEFTAKINQQKHLLIQQTMNAPFLEMVGFDKVFNKQSDFLTLKIVNLRNQNVSSAGSTLGEVCPNIEELDVSKNLFVSWDEILAICDCLPKLHWLNVSDNLLTFSDTFGAAQYIQLKTLICGMMELTWSDVCKIAHVFPRIEEFRAPHNKIECLSDVEDMFTSLSLLDLEGNKIIFWSEICNLGILPVLEQLIIENIGLKEISFFQDEGKVLIFRTLKKLCVVNNLLAEWTSVASLNKLENLEHLKISKNPIAEGKDPETIHQVIIARIANLKFLNGVEITPKERRGAEYDYIKKYGLEWLQSKGTEHEAEFLKLHDRYLELIQKYGEPEESELIVKPQIIKSSLINLTLICDEYSIEKKLPPSMTIQKLMMLIQKLFNLQQRPELLYVSNTDQQIQIPLKEEMREIGIYSMRDGDEIIVQVQDY